MARPEKVQIEIEIPDLIDAVIASLKENETLVEVVRCKECIHYMEINQPYPQMYCIKHNLDPRGDDYCSYGERRDNG